LTIFLAIACSIANDRASEFRFCVNYLESKETANRPKVGSVFNFASKLYERKQELEKSIREKGQLVERFDSLDKRMIPEILRTSADPANPFEIRWEMPREAPQRFPGILYDGIGW
jgi:hypothetical protein